MNLVETHSPEIELSQCMLRSANGAAFPGDEEANIAVGERLLHSGKCENGNVTKKKRVTEKCTCSDGSFFDCCICLELSKDPVVTNCGHLYCWSCLYQWLEISYAKECPVCKGEISVETLTPIYGHGGNKRVSDTKIPSRPQARRKETLRNSLNRSTEMNRHLQGRLEREYDRAERRGRYLQGRLERESNTHRYLQGRLEREYSRAERRDRHFQGRFERSREERIGRHLHDGFERRESIRARRVRYFQGRFERESSREERRARHIHDRFERRESSRAERRYNVR